MKKNTVFTVIAVLLMLATLCLPAAAQTWRLKTWWAGPADDNYGNDIVDIEFREKHQVFFGKHDRLYKWDFVAGQVHWLDFHGYAVKEVEVPRYVGNRSVVIHSVDNRNELYIRDADDLSVEAWRDVGSDGYIYSLDVDDVGEFLVCGSNDWERNYRWLIDIWGSNGWQLSTHTWNFKEGSGNFYGPMMMHPDFSQTRPQAYVALEEYADRFLEYTDSYDAPATDSYVTYHRGHIDSIAMTVWYGSTDTRLAALDSYNLIHVWNYSGDHLFTLNEAEDYSAKDDILEFTPNGELLVTAHGHWVRFWDVGQQALDHSFRVSDLPSDEDIVALAISGTGKQMAIGGTNGVAYIYEWTGGRAPAAPAKEVEPAQPTALLSNYPNPFNPETWIPYQLAEPAEVQVSIHSADGQLVRNLELGQVPAGVYSDKDRAAYWDGRNSAGEPVASGVYFYTLTAGEFSATRKMVIRK